MTTITAFIKRHPLLNSGELNSALFLTLYFVTGGATDGLAACTFANASVNRGRTKAWSRRRDLGTHIGRDNGMAILEGSSER